MEFRQKIYNAFIRELTPEAEIHPAFKPELIMRTCNDGSLAVSPSFYINKACCPFVLINTYLVFKP
ncbi:hypothetical protein ACJMK2_029729, partial [Sinanodonta woodiana]